MQKHNKHYHQLTQEQRYQILGLRKAGITLADIAEAVGVSTSTISRELKRNSNENGYDPKVAHTLSRNRRSSAAKATKRDVSTDIIIRESLSLGWSPIVRRNCLVST